MSDRDVSPPAPLRLDRSRQAAPQVFELLRERILQLRLRPGTVLSRTELAESFGLSQTPIRDALLRLGEEGLVDIFPQHATVVSRIDVGAARQAHVLRRAIECEVVTLLAAAPADPQLIARLRDQIERQAQLAGQPDAGAAFIEADRAFHRLMYEAAGVPELYELVRRRSGHVDRLRHLHLYTEGKLRAILADHRAIVDALAAGDAVAAQQAVRGHLGGTLAHVEDIRQAHPDYLSG